MQNTKKGNVSIIIVFIIVVLAFIAYGIFKKQTVEAPSLEVQDEQSVQTTNTSSNTMQQNRSTSEAPPEVKSPDENPEDLASLEMEAEATSSDTDDLLFEDLGFE